MTIHVWGSSCVVFRSLPGAWVTSSLHGHSAFLALVPPFAIFMEHHRPETSVEPKFQESRLWGGSYSLGPLNRKRGAPV